jgi:hypothetical protein
MNRAPSIYSPILTGAATVFCTGAGRRRAREERRGRRSKKRIVGRFRPLADGGPRLTAMITTFSLWSADGKRTADACPARRAVRPAWWRPARHRSSPVVLCVPCSLGRSSPTALIRKPKAEPSTPFPHTPDNISAFCTFPPRDGRVGHGLIADDRAGGAASSPPRVR